MRRVTEASGAIGTRGQGVGEKGGSLNNLVTLPRKGVKVVGGGQVRKRSKNNLFPLGVHVLPASSATPLPEGTHFQTLTAALRELATLDATPNAVARICYFSGDLANARLTYEPTTHTWRVNARLDALAAGLYRLAQLGRVILYQRRRQTGGFDYYCTLIR